MPDLLTTKQLAEYLQLSERSVYRLLERGELPAAKVGGQWRFRKSAVDAWLDLGYGGVTGQALDELVQASEGAGTAQRASYDRDAVLRTAPRVVDLLTAENIILDLQPGSRADVLAALVEQLSLPEPVDRALLLARLLERESLCSTALADGVALPHTPRTRERLLRAHHLIAVARTLEPVDFGALDGSRTSVLVLVLAGDERTHLTLLAKMAQLVREPAVSKELRTGDTASILDVLRRSERQLFERAPRE